MFTNYKITIRKGVNTGINYTSNYIRSKQYTTGFKCMYYIIIMTVVKAYQWRSQKVCWSDCSIRVTALLGYLDLSIPVFCFLEMPEFLLMYGKAQVLYTSNRFSASLLAEVSAHYTKFLVRHLPHLPTW